MADRVYLGNFEVEQQWARGERTLPRVTAAGGSAVVNHMDEFALLLAGAGDHVLLKAEPDPGYLAHLTGLGLALPAVHVVAASDPGRCVTEDVLDDPGLLAALSRLAAEGCGLVVHGVSELEELLAAKTGLPLAPDAATCKAVNSKVYSRRIAAELGLRQPHGWACTTTAEVTAAMTAAADLLRAGRTVVVKEAFGVSGKGIAVIDGERRLDRIRRMITKGEPGRAAFVVEEWVAKAADLNYQFTVTGGAVRFDFVKELITESGVHKGHRFPARLSQAQHDELRAAAQLLGGRLAADGYAGVVGVDAMVAPDGSLYPVLEINARHNMSSYQVRLQERFVGPGQVALARHYPLRLGAPVSFDAVRRALGDVLLGGAGGTGLLVNNFATVNAAAAAAEGGAFDGRLYGLLIADSDDELRTLDAAVEARLTAIERS